MELALPVRIGRRRPNQTAPEDTTVSSTDSFTVSFSNGETQEDVFGVPSTNIAHAAPMSDSKKLTLAVFFEVEGNNIQEDNRDANSRLWYLSDSPVSNSTSVG